MIAKVLQVKFNEKLGTYKVTKLIVDKDGETKEYNIFTNAKYHNVVADLKAGDSVDIKMEKNGKYWNVVDVTKLETSKGSGIRTDGGGQSNSVRQGESSNKDIAIARAVALKAGVELYCAMIAAGLTKKTLKAEAAVEEVFAITKRFEGYATLAEDIEALASDSSSISKEGGSFEEVPFD